MDMSGMYESNPGTHRFNPKTASPALKAAIAELARETERAESEFDGLALGTLYELAATSYGGDLPQFWRIWQQWNIASKEPPAEMGDL